MGVWLRVTRTKARPAALAQVRYRHTPWDQDTHLAKLARFWVTLAMSVRVRAVRSSGYS